MTDPMQAAQDRFDTIVMEAVATAESRPEQSLTLAEFADIVTAIGAVLKANAAELAEAHSTIREVRDAWYNMADELGAGRDGRFSA